MTLLTSKLMNKAIRAGALMAIAFGRVRIVPSQPQVVMTFVPGLLDLPEEFWREARHVVFPSASFTAPLISFWFFQKLQPVIDRSSDRSYITCPQKLRLKSQTKRWPT